MRRLVRYRHLRPHPAGARTIVPAMRDRLVGSIALLSGLLAVADCGGLVTPASQGAPDDALGTDATDPIPVDATVADASRDATVGDAKVCAGHDEDGDGIPDDCDSCPNVPSALSAKAVGDECNSPILGGLTTRLAWDPFLAFAPPARWATFGPVNGSFALGPDGDSIVGGSTSDDDLRFLAGPAAAGPGAAGVAVTAVLSVTAEGSMIPSAGVIARVDGTAGKQFFLCGVGAGVGYFYLLHTATGSTCDGGACNLNAFNYDGGAANTSQLAFPKDVPHALGSKIGVRMTVTAGNAVGDAGASTGDVECRVFDPSAPSALLTTDSRYAIRLSIAPPASRWIAAGDVGVYVQRAKVRVDSVDVLKGI
jgi:hypothetical protein